MTQSTASRSARRVRSTRPSVVTLFHVTTATRVKSVLAFGLLPSLSQGARDESWLVSSSRRSWAVEHTRTRHRTESVAVLRLSVARDQLVRRKRGVWTSAKPIPPSAIQSVRPAPFVA